MPSLERVRAAEWDGAAARHSRSLGGSTSRMPEQPSLAHMTGVDLAPPVRYWACPSCGMTDRSQRADVHTQFHPCPALHGFNTPLVEIAHPGDTPAARHVLVEREDYARGESPVTAIRTERPDGSNDVNVLAQTVRVTIGAN